jgi:hypothetical protein
MVGLWFMVFNTTFNNISVISWRIGCIGGENHRTATSHWQTLSHNVVSSTPLLRGIQIHVIFVVMGTDCIGRHKSQLPYDHDHDCSFKERFRPNYTKLIFTFSLLIGLMLWFLCSVWRMRWAFRPCTVTLPRWPTTAMLQKSL